MWLTLSAPQQIMYSYRDWNHNTSEELPLRADKTALGSVREINADCYQWLVKWGDLRSIPAFYPIYHLD